MIVQTSPKFHEMDEIVDEDEGLATTVQVLPSSIDSPIELAEKSQELGKQLPTPTSIQPQYPPIDRAAPIPAYNIINDICFRLSLTGMVDDGIVIYRLYKTSEDTNYGDKFR